MRVCLRIVRVCASAWRPAKACLRVVNVCVIESVLLLRVGEHSLKLCMCLCMCVSVRVCVPVCACVCLCVCAPPPQPFYSMLLIGFAGGHRVFEIQQVISRMRRKRYGSLWPSPDAFMAMFNWCVPPSSRRSSCGCLGAGRGGRLCVCERSAAHFCCTCVWCVFALFCCICAVMCVCWVCVCVRARMGVDYCMRVCAKLP